LLSIFKSIPELSYFGLSSIYSGTILFVIDYVIQIQFESRNFLKQLTIQSSSPTFSNSNQKNQVIDNNDNNDNKKRESIWKMEIGKRIDLGAWFVRVDFGAWFVGVFILIAIFAILLRQTRLIS
jgi:hypothetical protein